MLSHNWKWGSLAAGVLFILAGPASASDDLIRLDVKKSTAPLLGTANSASEFSHADRDKATNADDDLEDVHLRYRLGYYRGYYGGSYFFPRFYAFRRGYWDGLYGGGFYGGFYPRYYASYVAYSAPVYYAPPIQTYYYANPCVCPISGGDAPTVALTSRRETIPNPERSIAPAGREYRYDGPPRAKMPGNRFDGGPSAPIPRPAEPAPKMKDPDRKLDPADGRLVKMQPPTKKYRFAAYGEKPAEDRGTFVAKEKN